MTIRPEVLFTILGMALVTYSTRIGGVWLMSRFTLSKRVENWLNQIPGAVLISLVTPLMVTSGIATIFGAGLTILVARRTGNLLGAMVGGVVLVWFLRTFTGLS